MLVVPGPGPRDKDGLPNPDGGRVVAGSCCEVYLGDNRPTLLTLPPRAPQINLLAWCFV